eukprot:2776342-Lingulodinium_polyedra.AAC.1
MAPVMHEGNMKVVPHPLQPVDELINTVTEEPMSEDEWVLFEHQTTQCPAGASEIGTTRECLE